MKSSFLAVVLLGIGSRAALAQADAGPEVCPPGNVVLIQRGVNDTPQTIMVEAAKPNATVLLAPDVSIDFQGVFADGSTDGGTAGDPLIVLGHCTTLASYEPNPVVILQARPDLGTTQAPPVPGSGRTPHSLGPALIYGPAGARANSAAFIEARCTNVAPDAQTGNGARILGLRIIGPTPNDQQSSQVGINVNGCNDIEIANDEVSGWGGSAVQVIDAQHFCDPSGNCTTPASAPPLILNRVHDNFIHNNQHSSKGGDSLGYGVSVGVGGFAQITRNLFDYNKHSTTANGKAGGYEAVQNLYLKGGGFLNETFERDIQVADVHGTESCLAGVSATVAGGILGAIVGGLLGLLLGGGLGGVLGLGIAGGIIGSLIGHSQNTAFNCGDAGLEFLFDQNTFQYSKTTDLKIRGKPKGMAAIKGNIFARQSQDDAIGLETQDNVTVFPTNQFADDTFGRYGVCDIDGDGVDDLVLMTGVTWWFSSAGQYPWSFLKADPALLKDVKLGDVDGDGRCDVLKSGGHGEVEFSSGGSGDWKPLGNFLAPFDQMQLGRFDPASQDFSQGIKPPTHFFQRRGDGVWLVTPLSQPAGWVQVQSSSFPFTSLRFADFTGDGVTDVVANEGGGWAFSESARSSWQHLNDLQYAVNGPNLFIADMDVPGQPKSIDDILALSFAITGQGSTETTKLVWTRSADGRGPWGAFKQYVFDIDLTAEEDYVGPGVAFVGKFRGPTNAATLTIDSMRVGHFFRLTQAPAGEDWSSLFSY
jgi:hypothetical protein